MTTLYDIPVRTIDGTEQTLAPYLGQNWYKYRQRHLFLRHHS